MITTQPAARQSPASQRSQRVIGAVAAELQSIRERFETSDRAAWRARVHCDHDQMVQAQAEADQASEDHHAAAEQLAELGLLLLRYAVERRPEDVKTRLADVIRDVLRRDNVR